jgi:hypothetical protein
VLFVYIHCGATGVFLMDKRRLYKWSSRKSMSRVEAGSITPIIALRVVGGDVKGSLESETVKYGCESHGTRTQK